MVDRKRNKQKEQLNSKLKKDHLIKAAVEKKSNNL
jgi:hypothetical protein